jgi:diaminopimelate decarboxylase
MTTKSLPVSPSQLTSIVANTPTPFYLYDEKAIRENARNLNKAFSWNTGFKEYFAVKALPNPSILRILKEEGFGVDCRSLPELLLAEREGFRGEEIMFTSNDTPLEDFQKAKELGAIINLDDISHLAFIEESIGLPDTICFRYNPGRLRSGNAIIGKPEEAKYGLTREQLFTAYELAKKKGVKKFGLHTMIASNELHAQYFVDTAVMLFDLVTEISQNIGITFDFVNIGGGIGIPYRPEQKKVNLEKLSQKIEVAYKKILRKSNNSALRLCMENGRVITGPYGYLITKVLHKKDTYKEYVGVDASMANLMRPGMYGAYHHITVLGKETQRKSKLYDVTGSLCENNDKFAIDRNLPEIAIRDILVIHDVGAHGHAMGFNYNGKLRCAEYLLHPNGTVSLIRRAETVADYFRTLEVTPFERSTE